MRKNDLYMLNKYTFLVNIINESHRPKHHTGVTKEHFVHSFIIAFRFPGLILIRRHWIFVLFKINLLHCRTKQDKLVKAKRD